MAAKSDYLRNKLLDHALGKLAFTMPTNVYLALCTATVTSGLTGSTITEATYTGYARKQIQASDLSSAASGLSQNSAQLVFNACTGGSSTITYFAICDNSSTGAGNLLYYGPLTASKTIDTSNTPPTVAVGALQITES